jgi:hypothetical protein
VTTLTDVSEERTVSVSIPKMEVPGSFEIPANIYQATVPYFIYLLSEFFNDCNSSYHYIISEWLLKEVEESGRGLTEELSQSLSKRTVQTKSFIWNSLGHTRDSSRIPLEYVTSVTIWAPRRHVTHDSNLHTLPTGCKSRITVLVWILRNARDDSSTWLRCWASVHERIQSVA